MLYWGYSNPHTIAADELPHAKSGGAGADVLYVRTWCGARTFAGHPNHGRQGGAASGGGR
jgi:hypothetical protein